MGVARPKLKPGDETERLCIQIPAADLQGVRRAAANAGLTLSRFVRAVLLSAAAGSAEEVLARAAVAERARPGAPGLQTLKVKRAPDERPEVLRTPEPGCVHVWKNVGWAVVCSKCQEVKR